MNWQNKRDEIQMLEKLCESYHKTKDYAIKIEGLVHNINKASNVWNVEKEEKRYQEVSGKLGQEYVEYRK